MYRTLAEVVPLFPAWLQSLLAISRGVETWNEVNKVRFFELAGGGKKKKHVRTFVPGQVFMNGSFFSYFPSLFFCEWKTTGKSRIKAHSLPGDDWLQWHKRHLRLLGARLPGFWLAYRGNRDFIHKSVYSFGQRQEIRALERGNPPITNFIWPELEKQVPPLIPKSCRLQKWQHSWPQKVTPLQYKLI